jgi:4-aminobutyrate aminotransferase
VENAIKIARAATGRDRRHRLRRRLPRPHLLAVALTGKVQPYKAGFGPFPPERLPRALPDGLHADFLDDDVKKAVQQLFKADIEPTRVAAIIFEPVQGEGGFNPVQAEAWCAAARSCATSTASC